MLDRARTRARDIMARCRVGDDDLERAARWAAVATVVLTVALTAVDRAYQASGPGSVIPADAYARYGGGGGEWVVTGYLVATDAVGRVIYPATAVVPEALAWLLVYGALAAYYVIALDLGWRLLRRIQADIETREAADHGGSA